MKKLFKKTLIVASITATLVISSGLQAATTLKFAHAAPESDLQQDLAKFFKKEVESRSSGDLMVNIFPHGQLGNDEQMIDGVRSGIIDIEMSGLNNFSGMMPESAAFTLPFMFPNRETAYRVLDGKVGSSVNTKFEAFGIKGLGFPENGYRNISNNEGPVTTPADLKGMRMRVNNSVALNEMFSMLGANPQQIPVAELYTALETGVVNAQDHPIGVVLSFKFFEVQKYLSLSQHAYSPLMIAMNLNKFSGLSAEEKKIIMDVAAEAVSYQRELSIKKEDVMIADLEKNGMKVNRDVDGAAFQKAVKPVWTKFIEENGDNLINSILEASK
jgi:tripartite ATP-independent transporter DctP family solute receptor